MSEVDYAGLTSTSIDYYVEERVLGSSYACFFPAADGTIKLYFDDLDEIKGLFNSCEKVGRRLMRRVRAETAEVVEIK